MCYREIFSYWWKNTCDKKSYEIFPIYSAIQDTVLSSARFVVNFLAIPVVLLFCFVIFSKVVSALQCGACSDLTHGELCHTKQSLLCEVSPLNLVTFSSRLFLSAHSWQEGIFMSQKFRIRICPQTVIFSSQYLYLSVFLMYPDPFWIWTTLFTLNQFNATPYNKVSSYYAAMNETKIE